MAQHSSKSEWSVVWRQQNPHGLWAQQSEIFFPGISHDKGTGTCEHQGAKAGQGCSEFNPLWGRLQQMQTQVPLPLTSIPWEHLSEQQNKWLFTKIYSQQSDKTQQEIITYAVQQLSWDLRGAA